MRTFPRAASRARPPRRLPRENRCPAQTQNASCAVIAVPTRHETPPAQRSPSRPDPERPRAKAAVPPGHKTFLRGDCRSAQALNVHAQRLPPRPDTKRSCGHGPARHAPSACIYPAGSASAVCVPADTPRGVLARCPASPLMPMNAPRGMPLRNVPAPADAPEAPPDRTRAACPFALQRPSLILSQSHVYAACPEQWPRGPSLPTGTLRTNASPSSAKRAAKKVPERANRPPQRRKPHQEPRAERARGFSLGPPSPQPPTNDSSRRKRNGHPPKRRRILPKANAPVPPHRDPPRERLPSPAKRATKRPRREPADRIQR